jgi:hypothetical protein
VFGDVESEDHPLLCWGSVCCLMLYVWLYINEIEIWSKDNALLCWGSVCCLMLYVWLYKWNWNLK